MLPFRDVVTCVQSSHLCYWTTSTASRRQSVTQRRLGSADGSFLARSTPQIRAHCHSNGANVIPTAAGCKKLLSFLRARPSIWHVDRAMQSEFVEAAGGVVFHAIPSLFGWLESESDIEGAGWVRPAHQVQ